MIETIGMKGLIHFEVRDAEGHVKDERDIDNLITNVGFAEVAALIGAVAGGAAFDYIAIGTGAVAADVTDTTLNAEISTSGGSRAASSNSQVTTTVTNDTMQAEVTYNFTGVLAIVESGLFNAASAGDMLSRQVFSVINVANGDSLTVTWKIKVS